MVSGTNENGRVPIVAAAGYPFLAMGCVMDEKLDLDTLTKSRSARFGILFTPTQSTPFRIRSTPDRILPLLPIWPGFVLDTAIYAALWWGLALSFTGVHRTLRRVRNRCPKCGYDLRGQIGVVSGQSSVVSEIGSTENRELRTDRSVRCPECGWGREGAEGRTEDSGLRTEG